MAQSSTTVNAVPAPATMAFPADRDRYVREHGSERTGSLALRKIAGWGARKLPSVRFRLACLRRMGVTLPAPIDGEKRAWIGHDVYVDEVFPELITIEPSWTADSDARDPLNRPVAVRTPPAM